MGTGRIPLTSEVAECLIKSVESSPELWNQMGEIPQLDGESASLSETDIAKARELYQKNSEMLKALDQVSAQYFKPTPDPSSTSSNTSSPSWSDYASAFYQGSGLADDDEDAKAAGGAFVSHYATPIVNGAIQVFTKPAVDEKGKETQKIEFNPITQSFNMAKLASSGHSVSGTINYLLGGPQAAAEAVITRYDKQMEKTGNYSPIIGRNYQDAMEVNLVAGVGTKIVGGLGAVTGAGVFIVGAIPEAAGHEALHTAHEGWNAAMTGTSVDLNYNPFPDVYGYDDAAGIVNGVTSLIALGWTAPLVLKDANEVSFGPNMKDVGAALTEISKPETSLTDAASIIFETQKTTAQRTWDAAKNAFVTRMENADKNILGDDPTQTPGVRLTRVGGTVGAVAVTTAMGGEFLGTSEAGVEVTEEVTQKSRVETPREGTAPHVIVGAKAKVQAPKPISKPTATVRPFPSPIDIFPSNVDKILQTIADQAARFETDTKAALKQLNEEPANNAFTNDTTPGVAQAAK